MACFEWKPEYEIDRGTIDSEHQHLLSLANRIVVMQARSGMTGALGGLIKQFYDYARFHFEHEEQLMLAQDYPHLDEHHDCHTKIIDEMNGYLKSSKSTEKLLANFQELARNWVINHIMEEDAKIGQHIRAGIEARKAEKAAGEPAEAHAEA
jgi:hemerythrin